jgi:hypothetical protein
MSPARSDFGGLIGTDGSAEVDELRDDENGKVWTYHFDHPARFPMPQFGANCPGIEGEGAVIHEGMRLLAKTNGQYEVRFNITAPQMPVNLRLQLILYDKQSRVPRTLTLPPILLKTSDSFDDSLMQGYDPISYIVSVRGYSQVIKETQRFPASTNGEAESEMKSDFFLLVKRIGAARFGSGVRYQTSGL